MERDEFVKQYVLSAVQGTAQARGVLRANDLVQDAIDAWEAMQKGLGLGEASIRTRKARVSPVEQEGQSS